MQNKNIEEEFVKKFVVKCKQERILWELNNSKKRPRIIWNFMHWNIFKNNCLTPTKYMPKDIMEKKLFDLGKTNDIYFIGEDYIGNISLKQAVDRANMGEICIIYCGNGIGYYQGEQEFGAPPRFLLLAQK